jgi:hypothetical protein
MRRHRQAGGGLWRAGSPILPDNSGQFHRGGGAVSRVALAIFFAKRDITEPPTVHWELSSR